MKRIKSMLCEIGKYAEMNPGIVLLVLNLFLGLFLLVLKDPASWFADTYRNAAPFFDTDGENVGTIISGRKGQESRMDRNLDGWTVTLGKFSSAGDSDRIEELLKTSLNLRKFTLLSGADPIRSAEFGLDGDEPTLELMDSSGKSLGKIIIGAVAQRSSGNYVMDEKNRIWLVKENLKLATGGGKRDYFLSRSLMPSLPIREKIREVYVKNSIRSEEYELVRGDRNDWTLQIAEREIPVLTEEVEKFLEALKNLKADEIDLDRSEELQIVPAKQNFRIEIRTDTNAYTISPIGTTKLGSYIFRREDLNYNLILDPWNLERILQKDLSDFTIPSGPSQKQF